MKQLYLTVLQHLLWWPIWYLDQVIGLSDFIVTWLREFRWTVEKKLLKELGLDDLL